MEITVAGFQMAVGLDVRENSEKILGAIDRATASGAEILLTPEGSLSGYTHQFDRDAWMSQSMWVLLPVDQGFAHAIPGARCRANRGRVSQ